MNVNTLVVVGVTRGTYAAEDVVAAVKATMSSTHVVVVDVGNSIQRRRGEYTLLRSEGEGLLGFHRANGVQWAIENKIGFKQVCLLTDETMLLGAGLDAWMNEQLSKPGIGLIGVEDPNNYDPSYRRCAPLFAEWKLPVDDLGNATRRTLLGDVLFMPYGLARTLYDNNALCPEGCDQWPLPYGVYLSWVSMGLNYYQVAWGSRDRPLPPLYVGTGKDQPPPHILSNRFLAYHSAKTALGFNEEELREVYKRMRGEAAKPIQPVAPVVSGRGVGEAVP